MSTKMLSKFDPFSMSADMVRRIATGREEVLADVLRVIEDNRNASKGPMQHLALLAPRGTGKTFMFRLIGLSVPDGEDDGNCVFYLHLPEEMSGLHFPSTLLEEIIRRVNGVPADQVVIPMREPEGAWERAAAQLDELLAERFGKGKGLLIVCIENFEVVIKEAFRRPEDQRRLRAWLDRPNGRIMLIAASSGGRFDGNSKAALFGFLRNIELTVWTPDQTVDFLERVMLARTGHKLGPRERARARAITTFTGGNPRMAVALAEILATNDSLTAAETLSAIIDDLTDYYRERLTSLGWQARHCLDALMRWNEPVSQSVLAERLGVRQSDISQAFKEMRQKALLNEERLPGSKERLYSVADRIFVHYYRQRQLRHGELTSLLELIVDLLTDLFTPEERADEGDKLYSIGRPVDARFMLDTLPQQGPIACEEFWWESLRNFTVWVEECANRWGLPKSGWHDILIELQSSPRNARALADKVRQQGAPSSLIPGNMQRVIVGLARLCAGETDAALAQFQHVASATADDRIAAVALLGKGLTFSLVRQWAEAEQASDDAISHARRAGDTKLLIRALRFSIYCANEIRNHQKATALREEALALAKATHDYIALARLYIVISYLDQDLIDDAAAIPRLIDAYQAATNSGNDAERSEAAGRLATIMHDCGQASEALPISREALIAARQTDNHWLLIMNLSVYSRCLYSTKQIEDGLKFEREAVLVAKKSGSPYLLARALSFLAYSLSWIGSKENNYFKDEALLLADQVLDCLSDEMSSKIFQTALMAKSRVFEARDDWSALIGTARMLYESAIASEDRYIMARAFFWIATGLQATGQLEECVIESQKGLKVLESQSNPQIYFEIELHRILLDSLMQLNRWDAVWQCIDVILNTSRKPVRSALRFAVLSAVVIHARDDTDRLRAVQFFENSDGWNDVLSQSVNDYSLAPMVGLYLATVTLLRGWTRTGPLINAARWEWVDKSGVWIFVVGTIAGLCSDHGRAIAFSAFNDLLTNGLIPNLKSTPDQQLSIYIDTKPPGITFLEGCLSSFFREIDDAGFLTDVVGTLQERFPDNFEGQRKILTAAADFHRSGCNPAILARMDPDIAQTLRMIWLPDSEGDQPPPPPKRTVARKTSAKKRSKP